MKQMLMTLMALLMVGAGCKTGKVDSSRVERLRQRQITDEELQAISDLHVAAEEGDLAKVKQCLKAGTDIDCVAGKASSRILHKAARAGDKAMAAFLIQQKANINAWAIYGTPLDLAIKEGHADVAQLLRKHGAKTGEELEAKEK